MNIVETDPPMAERRELLIRELRSGNWKKGVRKLVEFGESYNRDVRGYVTDLRKTSFCCIGVACRLLGIKTRTLNYESDVHYLAFRSNYGVTDKQKFYLMGMNDGKSVKWSDDPKHLGSFMVGAPVIRAKGAPERDFTFIARFLEIMWGMSPNK